MQFIKKVISKIILLAYVILLPIVSFAQQSGGSFGEPLDKSGKIVNPIKAETINDLIKTLLEGLIRIGMPIIALAIIYSGFLFVFARGNSEKLTKAKDALLYTLIGAAILLGSWGIAQLISDTVLSL
jgi:ABC-type cobalt transport system substrate-binding protein